MAFPQISVIIPIYNKEKYLKKCIESVINQTYSKLEIILIDDGSKDSSWEIIQSYEKLDSRIIAIHQANQGVVSARKNGYLKSTGEYISFIDADDWLDLNFYESFVRCIQENDADIIVSGYVEEYKDASKGIDLPFDSGIYSGERLLDIYSKMIFSGVYYREGINPSLWNKVFKRNIINQEICIENPTLNFGEDGLISYVAIANAKSVQLINEKKAYHYNLCDENSLSRHFDYDYFSKLRILLDSFVKGIPEELHSIIEEQLRYYSAFMLMIGIERFAYNKNTIQPIKKAKILKKLLSKYKKSYVENLTSLPKLPENEKKVISMIECENYFGIIIHYYKLAIKKKALRGN